MPNANAIQAYSFLLEHARASMMCILFDHGVYYISTMSDDQLLTSKLQSPQSVSEHHAQEERCTPKASHPLPLATWYLSQQKVLPTSDTILDLDKVRSRILCTEFHADKINQKVSDFTKSVEGHSLTGVEKAPIPRLLVASEDCLLHEFAKDGGNGPWGVSKHARQTPHLA